jgi:hypothetical protein
MESTKKWTASIRIGGNYKYLGNFPTRDAAQMAFIFALKDIRCDEGEKRVLMPCAVHGGKKSVGQCRMSFRVSTGAGSPDRCTTQQAVGGCRSQPNDWEAFGDRVRSNF